VESHYEAIEHSASASVLIDTMSVKDRSDIELCRTKRSLVIENDVLNDRDIEEKKKEFWRTLRAQSLAKWFDLLDVYCPFNPGAGFIDPLGHFDKCSKNEMNPFAVPLKEYRDELFRLSMIMQSNVLTLYDGVLSDRLLRRHKIENGRSCKNNRRHELGETRCFRQLQCSRSELLDSQTVKT
jgi:hypothetical protein